MTCRCREAIQQLQENPHVEMAFYLYVVNMHHQLVGVASLRQLVTSRPDTLMHEIMQTEVVKVSTGEDQEEVARIVSRYDLAVPVVDEANRMLGIVTVDDVIDVLREEASEDMLKLVGAGEQLSEVQSVVDSVRSRLPWLAAAWLGGVGASFVITGYERTLAQLMTLAAFIPVVLGMGGNVGTQTLTIMVRSIATGRIGFRRTWAVLGREVGVGLVSRTRLRPGPGSNGLGHQLGWTGAGDHCPGGRTVDGRLHDLGRRRGQRRAAAALPLARGPSGGYRALRDHGHGYPGRAGVLQHCHGAPRKRTVSQLWTTQAVILRSTNFRDIDKIRDLVDPRPGQGLRFGTRSTPLAPSLRRGVAAFSAA